MANKTTQVILNLFLAQRFFSWFNGCTCGYILIIIISHIWKGLAGFEVGYGLVQIFKDLHLLPSPRLSYRSPAPTPSCPPLFVPTYIIIRQVFITLAHTPWTSMNGLRLLEPCSGSSSSKLFCCNFIRLSWRRKIQTIPTTQIVQKR